MPTLPTPEQVLSDESGAYLTLIVLIRGGTLEEMNEASEQFGSLLDRAEDGLQDVIEQLLGHGLPLEALEPLVRAAGVVFHLESVTEILRVARGDAEPPAPLKRKILN